MSARWEVSAQALVNDLQRVFAGRLISVLVYGQVLDEQAHARLTSFALVASLSHDDLEACAGLTARWARSGIDTPLILPDNEFRRSLDTFPLEYAEIIAAHARVFGRDPFDGVTLDKEDLRRACERQVKSHLLHLREGYIEAGGAPLAVAQLVSASTPAFAALLRNVAELLGVTAPTRGEVALAGARAVGLQEAVVRQVLSLAASSTRTADGARLFPSYLTAVEQLAHAVDTWQR
jgi:hypothetical protein